MSIAAAIQPRRQGAAIAVAALFVVALIVLLDGPLWLVKLVPTQDGPVHLAQADLIARFGWGGTLEGSAASFYQWNPRIEPNSAIYLLLAALMRLTADPLLANTLFLSLYGLIWIAAAYAVARAETARPRLPMLLLLPIAFGIFIHWGFYNYALGVPLFLLFAVFWRRLGERRDLAALAATSLVLLALCLTHITTVVAACLLMASSGLMRAVTAYGRTGLRSACDRLLRDAAWATTAALPALILIGSFLLTYHNIPAEAPGTDGGLAQIARRIVAATYLFTFSWWEIIGLAPLLGALAIAGAVAVRRFSAGDLLWPIFCILVVMLSVLNLKTGSASLSERLAPFSGIAVVLTIASRQPSAQLVRTLCAAALAGLAGQSGIRALAYGSWAPTLDNVLAAGRANPDGTFVTVDLVPLRNSAMFTWRVRPTLHADQIAALAAGGAGLSSPLPSTRYFGYFPLQYVEAHDFMRAAADWEAEPEAAAITRFRSANRGAPRVLLVTAFDDTGPALARKLGYEDCANRDSGPRRLVVCASRSRLTWLQR